MTKNMTRKGLAFGAGLALVASGLAGAPAQAAGLTGLVTLLPSSGPETAFTVGKGADHIFKLTAQPASNVSAAGNLKFLVTDTSVTIEPGLATQLMLDDGSPLEYPTYSTLTAGADKIEWAGGTNKVKIYDANASTNFAVGDIVEFSVDVKRGPLSVLLLDDTHYTVAEVASTFFTVEQAPETVTVTLGTSGSTIQSTGTAAGNGKLADAEALKLADGDTITTNADIKVITAGNATIFAAGDFTIGTVADVAVAGPTVEDTFVIDEAPAAATASSAAVNLFAAVTATVTSFAKGTIGTTVTVNKVRTTRTDSSTYVIDSGVTSSAVQATFRSTGAAAQTFTVQAWVDNFDNNRIDATEYVSPAQTVSFADLADIVWTTTLVNPVPGAENLTANISTTPMLNGVQLNANDDIRAVFTRANSSSVLLDNGDATQDAITGVWTSEIDLELTAVTLTTEGTVGSNAGFTLDSNGAKTAAGWAGGLLTPDKAVQGVASGTASGTVLANKIVGISVATTKVVTVSTNAAHQLTSGDKVSIVKGTSALGAAVTTAAMTSRTVSVTSPTAFTFVLDLTATTVDAASVVLAGVIADTIYTVVTYTAGDTTNQYFNASRVVAGDFSANAYYSINNGTNFLKGGSASAKGTLATLADDVVFTSTASADVQGISDTGNSVDTNGDLLVKAGTKTLTVAATVLDKDGAAVGAGRNVAVTMTNRSANVTVNGLKVTQNLATDSSGQVTLVVASSTGLATEKVDITAVAEGVAGSTSSIRVLWATAALQMADLKTTDAELPATQKRTIAAGSNYAVDLFVTDQWYTVADSETHRLKVAGQGVTGQFLTLAAGKASVTVTDTGVSTDYNTVLTLQKKNTAGVFADTTTVVTLRNLVEATPGILIDADGSNLYGMANSADLSDAVAKKALVERDVRTANTNKPAYVNAVTVNGKITDVGTNVGQAGAVVTVTGPNNILFSNGSVDKRGTLTFVADQTTGAFTVDLFSTSAQTDTVITITSAGVSKTVKVSFVGIGVGEGTSLVITMPAAVKPASTFQVKAKLADAFGNGVVTTAGSIKVTYTGAGIVFGTLPTNTDANGELMFSVLLGSNDTGSVNVTVSYDQNVDKDFVDVKDLNATGTTAITASGKVAASSDTIVNVGTFSGKLVVYALNAAGSEVSYKIAGKWVTQVVTSDLLMRYDRVVGATGKTIKVDIYVDGVLKLAKSVVTK